jgi:hypothetical protein
MSALTLVESAALDVQRIDRTLDDACRLAEGATVFLDLPVHRPAGRDPDAARGAN